MDLRHLETFVRIAELKSFTKAAEDLYLTQPTVSKQIVDLERFFGIRLIDRTKRSVELTGAGAILFKYAKDFMELKKELIQTIADFKGLKNGAIHLGASNIPGIYILPKVIKSFKEKYGDITLRMTISDSGDVITRTEQGQMDVGFVGAKDETRKLDYKKFLEDTIVMVGPNSYPDTIRPIDLKAYPFIIREPGSGTRRSFETALKKLDVESPGRMNVVAELTDTVAIKELVKNGMGMAYISRMAVAEDLAAGRLKLLRLAEFSGVKRSFFIVTRKGKTMLPQVRALIDTIDALKKASLLGNP